MNTASPKGQTTDQMRYAPAHAVYIWPNEALAYPKLLARVLARNDLHIIPLTRLNLLRGFQNVRVVIDHACVLSPHHRDFLAIMRVWNNL